MQASGLPHHRCRNRGGKKVATTVPFELRAVPTDMSPTAVVDPPSAPTSESNQRLRGALMPESIQFSSLRGNGLCKRQGKSAA
mmetsp:Transcript_33580/g.71606  ORF Transcript_33580/g.71606 Transcript_33580/m.71606 type:complete len:83 (-) Transcript_33580:341-589(-)